MDNLPLHFHDKIKCLANLSVCRTKTVALITKGKKILYSGYNNAFRTKFMNQIAICQHAEMNVLTQFINSRIRRNYNKYVSKKNKKKMNQYNLHKYTLWVFRISNFDKNTVLNSAPCFYCSNTMKKFGLRKVMHTTNENTLKKIDLRFYTTSHISEAQKKWNKK